MPAAFRTVTLLLALCAVAPVPASAWWDGGHKIVAQIADDELTVEERLWVMELLLRNPTHAELFVDPLKAELGDNVDGEARARWAFSQASVWADLVRGRRAIPVPRSFRIASTGTPGTTPTPQSSHAPPIAMLSPNTSRNRRSNGKRGWWSR